MLALTGLFLSSATAQLPPPELVESHKVTDAKGTTFYATWIAHNPNGKVRPEFVYQKAGDVEKRVFAGTAALKGERPVKVSARVLGLTKAVNFEWRAFAGGGADDQDSTEVPPRKDQNNVPIPGNSSIAVAKPGVYIGIVKDENGLVAKGFCRMKLGASGSFSATLNLGAFKYRLSSAFNDVAEAPFPPNSKDELPIALNFISNADFNRISLSIVLPVGIAAGPWTAELVPVDARYSTKNPIPLAGRYTVLLPLAPVHVGDGISPQGEGYAAMVVAPNGTVKMAGKLGDGTKLTAGAAIDEDSTISVFVNLPAKAGTVTGSMLFQEQPGNYDALGVFHVVKAAQFLVFDLKPIASRYLPPFISDPITVYLISNDFSDIRTKALGLPEKNGAVTVFPLNNLDLLNLKFDVKTGVLKGIFAPFVLGAFSGTSIEGVVYPAQNRIGGFHLSTGLSGLITTIDPLSSALYSATDVPQAIPDFNTTGITSTISVQNPPSSQPIDHCRVSVRITHPFIGDIKIKLKAPSGKEAVVYDRRGNIKDNLTLLDFPVPQLDGEVPDGNWILTVTDESEFDTGTLDSWSLRLSHH